MKKAPVSVVMPTYNNAGFIRDAIDSILMQSAVPRQIIVIDDGSTDDTACVMRGYGERIEYRVQENGGPAAARNHGMRLAGEPLVAFLDADDVWHPRKIELQLRCMERVPEIGLLATQQFDWPIANFPPLPEGWDEPTTRMRRVTWEQLVVKTLILTSTVLMKREKMAQVGDFDLKLFGPEDRDFFLRFAGICPVAMLDVPLTGYRDTVGSVTKQTEKCERGMRRILRQLDDTNAWKGRWWLRAKSYSYMHHTCAASQARAGNHVRAVGKTLKAMARYPLPYRRDEVYMGFERPKRLMVNLLRMLKLKAPDRAGKTPPPARDAMAEIRLRLNEVDVSSREPDHAYAQ